MNCTEVDCTEINNLIELLQAKHIPFEARELDGGIQVRCPSFTNASISAITTKYSFGHQRGLIEIMGLLTVEELEHDEVLGSLSAENVLARIEADYVANGSKWADGYYGTCPYKDEPYNGSLIANFPIHEISRVTEE